MTGAITGGIGDIMYAIPAMRGLNIDLLYVKENFYPAPYGSMYTAVKRILMLQGINTLPTRGGLDFNIYEDGLRFDYDLDDWRRSSGRGRLPILWSMLTAFKLPARNWNRPWLINIPVKEGDYNLIFLTRRWRDGSTVDWSRIHVSNPIFIGLPDDHAYFCHTYYKIPWIETADLLEMATLIAECKALYCNQGVALTLAQGLGKEYYLERKPNKTNTLFRTPNEHLLN